MFVRVLAYAMREPRWCYWCTKRSERKCMFKLRDGPVDWFFCSQNHALLWCEWRHRNRVMHKFLKLSPHQRTQVLAGRTVEQYAESSEDF